MQEDRFPTALYASEDALAAADADVLRSAVRVLACQAAYAKRNGAYLPLTDVVQWIESGRKEADKREVVLDGMEQIREVLASEAVIGRHGG